VVHMVGQAKVKAIADFISNLFSDKPVTADQLAQLPVTVSAPGPVNNGNGNGNLERFSVALGHYLDWLSNVRKRRQATIDEYRSMAERFVKFANDPSMGAVDIDMAKAFLADVAKDVSDARVNTHQNVCAAVFEHARKERRKFTGENPFDFAKRQHTPKSKAKFNVGELNKFFGSPVFTERQIKPKAYSISSALPWATVVALFSGLGLEEVCQLRPKDIRKEGAHWVIRVTPEAAVSGKLKRKARDRTVPLHPELERVGFLKYVKALPSSSARIFPNLPVNENKKKLGASLGKAFNRWRVKLGIKREGEQLDFHSLRHSFGKAIEDAGISAEDRARLMGHEIEGISSSVYSAPELTRVAPQVARVTWRGLRIK